MLNVRRVSDHPLITGANLDGQFPYIYEAKGTDSEGLTSLHVRMPSPVEPP